MGGCGSKPQAREQATQPPAKQATAQPNFQASPDPPQKRESQGTSQEASPAASSKQKFSQPPSPGQSDTIPARLGQQTEHAISGEDVRDNRVGQPLSATEYQNPVIRGPEPFVSPWNLAEAPAAVDPHGAETRLPYAAPFIPQPAMAGRRSSFPVPAMLQEDWTPGNRRALLVACNYATESAGALRGCALDILCLAHVLMHSYGFQEADIVVLHDQQPHANYLPTRENILKAAQWLMTGCQAGDSLMFAFCGRAASGDLASLFEGDFREGEEEGLLPSDYEREGAVSSAQLSKALCEPLAQGARLHCLVDAAGSAVFTLPCHSFSRKDGWQDWEGDVIADALAEQTTTMVARQVRRLPRGQAWQPPQGGELILICSVPDEEDGDEESVLQPCSGCVAYSFVQAVQQGHADSYNKLLRAMRIAVRNGPQHFEALPELSSSSVFDLDRSFLL